MSIFGNLGNNASKPAGLFGNAAASQPATASVFGNATTSQPAQSSLFGTTAGATPQPQQQGSSFGASHGHRPSTTTLFGGSMNQSAPPPPAGSSLFGTAANTQPQQQTTGGLFGSTATQQPQQQAAGGLFGSSFSQPQQPQPQQQQQQEQANGGLFGSTTQKPPGSSLFGATQTQQQQQQPQQPQQQQTQGSQFGNSQLSRIWNESDVQPRQKSIPELFTLVLHKWIPDSSSSLFKTYLYNQVSPDAAPFYRPGPQEDEDKWEEALKKAPTPGSIPVMIEGFQQLGARIINQEQHLQIIQGRLHEINNGLTVILRRHDLEISTRAAECRRRHVRLSQKCLALATKTQVLRNRGYALDGAEEELTQKLKKMERLVLDPGLGGRAEEIWARMVNVREKGRLLQAEAERAGKTIGRGEDGVVDEETLKQAQKILEDYEKQLAHLAKELATIKQDFEEWEASKKGPGKN